jgi:acyl phosphate:glycerol-3-phosphate acyltransferase
MTLWIASGICVSLFAYLFGSIPTGYWLGRILRGIDIRELGSGSTGATNVLRTLGKSPALATLVIDLLKGFFAVTLARWIFGLPTISSATPSALDAGQVVPWAMAIAALLALIGHARSIWINFSGGKSAATGLGVLIALSWQASFGAAAIFMVVLATSRIVSLSSIVAALSAALLAIVFRLPIAFVLVTMIGAAYVIARHRTNIRRIMAGTEPRLGNVHGRGQV